ncbi:MAG: family 1 glycosylhydrolase [Anaerolineales bacterium]
MRSNGQRTYPDLPIYITENGVEDAEDKMRPRYIAQHIHQVWRAVNFNFPVKGYFYWSLVDNFEWERGWAQRFRLWGLDVETQKRIKRPSVDLYAERFGQMLFLILTNKGSSLALKF